MTQPAGNVRDSVRAALEAAVKSLGVSDQDMPDLELQRARNRQHGDYASGAGLKLARILRKAPAQIARDLAERIDIPEVASEAAGGYVNFRLRDTWLREVVGAVVAVGPGYGSSKLGGGEKVQVEFASVNPTGPLHIGHGRGVIVGANRVLTVAHVVANNFEVQVATSTLAWTRARVVRRIRSTPAVSPGLRWPTPLPPTTPICLYGALGPSLRSTRISLALATFAHVTRISVEDLTVAFIP